MPGPKLHFLESGSEQAYRDLANSMSQLAWMAHADGHIYWYNDRWYEYTGSTLEEMQGWGWEKVHRPDHIERVVSFVKEAWKRPEPWELTFPLRSASGEYRWFLTRAVPMKNQNGEIVQWFGTNTDIQNQRDIEIRLKAKSDALAQSQEQLKFTLSSANIGSWTIDLQSRRTTLSDEARQIFGYESECRTSSEAIDEFLHPDDRERAKAKLAQALANNSPYRDEIRIIKPNGEMRWLGTRGQARYNEKGEPILLSGIVMDITEQVEARQRLEASERQLAHERDKLSEIFRESPAALAQWRGPEMIFEMVNPRYQALFPGRELVGKPFLEAIPEFNGQPFMDLFRRVLETGEPFVGHEVLAQHRQTVDGPIEDRYYDFTYLQIRDVEGKPYGVFDHAIDVTDRVLARRAIEESEGRFKQIANALPMIIWTARPDGFVDWYNDWWYEYLGLPRGTKWDDVETLPMHPDDVAETNIRWYQALREGMPFHMEQRFRRGSDGQYRWHLVHGVPVKDVNGTILKYVGGNTDIHEQKMAEKAAREAERSFRAFTEAIPQMSFIADDKGEMIYFSQRFYDYVGIPSGQYEGSVWKVQPVIHPDDLEGTILAWQECTRTGSLYQIEYRIRRFDGEFRWHLARAVPAHNQEGRIYRWYGTNTDIHDQKVLQEQLARAKAELEQKSNMLETVLEQMPMSVVFTDASGKLVFANKQMKKVWRHDFIPSETIEGYREYIGFHPDGRRFEGKDWPIARAITSGEVVKGEDVDVLLGDGTRGIIRINSAPVRNAKGEIIGGVVTSEDVTDQVRAHKNLEASEARYRNAMQMAESANAAKSSFLANMSHEIRTPLAAILGFSSLLKDRNLNADERDQYVDTIVRNGNSLTRIIDDILDLAKVEAGRLEVEEIPFSFYQLATDVVDLFKDKTKEKGIYLLLNIEESVPSQICSDPTRLRQILINLVGNAVKFTDHGGVRVNIRAAPLGERKVKVTVDVKDTGIGLTTEQKEKLFKPFVQADNSMTRKFGGTGLGLALSQRLSQALSGDISIAEGKPGQGCTFTLTFVANPTKRNTEAQSRIDSTARVEALSLVGLRILVVDDSPDNQFLVARLLTKNGAHVDTALDGNEGFNKALLGSYDIVLMDIQMPRMDGYQAKEALDKRGYEKPVIALTAHAMSDERVKTKAAGFAGHLTKPLIAAELLKAVANVVKSLH